VKAPAVSSRAPRRMLRLHTHPHPAHSLQMELPFRVPDKRDAIMVAHAILDRHRRVILYLEKLKRDPEARAWGALRREAEDYVDREEVA
jgi:hypothetical protein